MITSKDTMINYYNLMKQFIQQYQQIIHEHANIAIVLSPAMQHAKEITPYRESSDNFH